MATTFVHVQVNPADREAFIAATGENCAASVQEPGNLRFDFYQSAADADYFVLIESYVDSEAAAAHKTTAHYLEWRDTVAPMMAQARRGEAFKRIANG